MVYLDNAATTFPKPRQVVEALSECIKKYCGNPARSSHFLSQRSEEKVYEARERIAKILGVDRPEGVVFTYNATYAINLALKTFIIESCHVITSDIEHNAVIRPLEKLKRTLGIEYSTFSTDGDVESSIRSLLREDTKCIISTLCSNVTGKRVDIAILSKVARENNLILILDASQSIGHTDINLQNTPCDVLCAPAHKALFGIQGAGFAYFKEDRRRESFIEGGSGFDSIKVCMPELLPEGYEAGTLSTPAIVALSEGVKFVSDVGLSEIERRLKSLTDLLIDRLSDIPDIRIYPSEFGIVSFGYKGLSSSLIARELDKCGICSRAGLHCAPSVHLKLGTLDVGTVRLSLSYFNKARDIDTLYRAMKEIGSKI